jgi:hypothetical protein
VPTPRGIIENRRIKEILDQDLLLKLLRDCQENEKIISIGDESFKIKLQKALLNDGQNEETIQERVVEKTDEDELEEHSFELPLNKKITSTKNSEKSSFDRRRMFHATNSKSKGS